jgi:hypothetical protein
MDGRVVWDVVQDTTQNEEVGAFVDWSALASGGGFQGIKLPLRLNLRTYGAARRKTMLEIKMLILSQRPNAAMALRTKPTTNNKADQGKRPVTVQDRYLLGNRGQQERQQSLWFGGLRCTHKH